MIAPRSYKNYHEQVRQKPCERSKENIQKGARELSRDTYQVTQGKKKNQLSKGEWSPCFVKATVLVWNIEDYVHEQVHVWPLKQRKQAMQIIAKRSQSNRKQPISATAEKESSQKATLYISVQQRAGPGKQRSFKDKVGWFFVVFFFFSEKDYTQKMQYTIGKKLGKSIKTYLQVKKTYQKNLAMECIKSVTKHFVMDYLKNEEITFEVRPKSEVQELMEDIERQQEEIKQIQWNSKKKQRGKSILTKSKAP